MLCYTNNYNYRLKIQYFSLYWKKTISANKNLYSSNIGVYMLSFKYDSSVFSPVAIVAYCAKPASFFPSLNHFLEKVGVAIFAHIHLFQFLKRFSRRVSLCVQHTELGLNKVEDARCKNQVEMCIWNVIVYVQRILLKHKQIYVYLTS